jgi:hypothetical protein
MSLILSLGNPGAYGTFLGVSNIISHAEDYRFFFSDPDLRKSRVFRSNLAFLRVHLSCSRD